MKILAVRWTPQVNILLIGCECGLKFDHRADRRYGRCSCGRVADVIQLKQTSDLKNLRLRR